MMHIEVPHDKEPDDLGLQIRHFLLQTVYVIIGGAAWAIPICESNASDIQVKQTPTPLRHSGMMQEDNMANILSHISYDSASVFGIVAIPAREKHVILNGNAFNTLAKPSFLNETKSVLTWPSGIAIPPRVW